MEEIIDGVNSLNSQLSYKNETKQYISKKIYVIYQ